MRYTSTRNKAIDVSFEEAITSGYAPDGGLFVPRSLPTFTPSLLLQWKDLSYPQLMYHVLRLFIDVQEISDAELSFICEQALQGFDDPLHAIPVIPFPKNSKDTHFYVAELFHGPTFCFKDLGMRAVILMLHSFLKRSSRYSKGLTLLVSTTGDTGPAAAQIVHDLSDPRLRIIVHYPDDQISDFQRKQLTTLATDQVQVVAFAGGGDDMDEPIQNLLSNASSHPDSLWTGVNSYNIVRDFDQTCSNYCMRKRNVCSFISIRLFHGRDDPLRKWSCMFGPTYV
jgi:threonine synthase